MRARVDEPTVDTLTGHSGTFVVHYGHWANDGVSN